MSEAGFTVKIKTVSANLSPEFNLQDIAARAITLANRKDWDEDSVVDYLLTAHCLSSAEAQMVVELMQPTNTGS